jgi:hypothetical protein
VPALLPTVAEPVLALLAGALLVGAPLAGAVELDCALPEPLLA